MAAGLSIIVAPLCYTELLGGGGEERRKVDINGDPLIVFVA